MTRSSFFRRGRTKIIGQKLAMTKEDLNTIRVIISKEGILMKLLRLKKGEAAYLSIPEECTISTQACSVKNSKGEKLILIRVL